MCEETLICLMERGVNSEESRINTVRAYFFFNVAILFHSFCESILCLHICKKTELFTNCIFSIRPHKTVVKVHNIRITCKSRLNSKTYRLLTIEEYLLTFLIYLALALCQTYYRNIFCKKRDILQICLFIETLRKR